MKTSLTPTNIDGPLLTGLQLDGTTLPFNMSLYFDAQALEHVVRRLYRAAAAQFIHQSMLSAELSTIIGQAFINQDRLVVECFPLRAMQSCLVLEFC